MLCGGGGGSCVALGVVPQSTVVLACGTTDGNEPADRMLLKRSDLVVSNETLCVMKGFARDCTKQDNGKNG
jgi:hypothetical protein